MYVLNGEDDVTLTSHTELHTHTNTAQQRKNETLIKISEARFYSAAFALTVVDIVVVVDVVRLYFCAFGFVIYSKAE